MFFSKIIKNACYLSYALVYPLIFRINVNFEIYQKKEGRNSGHLIFLFLKVAVIIQILKFLRVKNVMKPCAKQVRKNIDISCKRDHKTSFSICSI